MRVLRTAAAALAVAIALVSARAVIAQQPDRDFHRRAQVANYAVRGVAPADPAYEQLSFWADADGATRVLYRWGGTDRKLVLQPLGASMQAGGFALRFPNGLVLDVVPEGDTLRVRDRKGGYDKVFAWKYEGPVDGHGTFCTPCVDEAEAGAFVRDHFIAGPRAAGN